MQWAHRIRPGRPRGARDGHCRGGWLRAAASRALPGLHGFKSCPPCGVWQAPPEGLLSLGPVEQERQALPGDGPESLESVKLGPAGERWGVTKTRPSPPADAPPHYLFCPLSRRNGLEVRNCSGTANPLGALMGAHAAESTAVQPTGGR